jgi:hypothetical protein
MRLASSLESKVLGARFAGALAVAALAVFAAGGGCYNPNISTGGFKCSSEFVKECPDGFSCVGGRCWKGGIVIDSGVPDIKPEAPVDTPPAEKPAATDAVDATPDKVEAACTIKPVAGCTPATSGKCDPVCQTGCDGCSQKCSVNTAGALTCNAPSGASRANEGDACDQVSAGTDQQTDECAPGLVCVELNCKRECARLCRTNADCPESTCTRDYVTGFKVCDLKAVDCNPVKALAPNPCPLNAQGCYLSSTVTDRRVCDCPGMSLPEGRICKLSRDCLPGMACVDATGTGDYRCRIVCSLTGSVSGCTGTQTCQALNGSIKYGFCRI